MKATYAIAAGAAVFILANWTARPGWQEVIAGVVVASVMAFACAKARATGPALVVMLAGLYVVPSSLINIPEGVLFDVIRPSAAPLSILRELAASLLTALAVASVAGRMKPAEDLPLLEQPFRTVPGLMWRLSASVAVFVFCYFAAGAAIYPFVKDYYHVRTMPPLSAIAAMQVLRSFALIGVAFPLLRVIPSRRDAMLVIGIALPALGSLVPLLPVNDLMPPIVRMVHAIETVPYYALYGVLVARWFGVPASLAAERSLDAAAPGVA